MTTFKSRPLHLFGSVGIFLFSAGFLTCLYLTIIKLLGGQSIGDRPLLQLGIMLITVGIQVTLFGLIAEQITVIKNERKATYRIRETQS